MRIRKIFVGVAFLCVSVLNPGCKHEHAKPKDQSNKSRQVIAKIPIFNTWTIQTQTYLI
jgi:hypothetical protein